MTHARELKPLKSRLADRARALTSLFTDQAGSVPTVQRETVRLEPRPPRFGGPPPTSELVLRVRPGWQVGRESEIAYSLE